MPCAPPEAGCGCQSGMVATSCQLCLVPSPNHFSQPTTTPRGPMSPGACLHSNVRSFSHPDYTVGSGIAPDLRGNSLARGLASHQRSLTAGRDSASLGRFTLPRRRHLTQSIPHSARSTPLDGDAVAVSDRRKPERPVGGYLDHPIALPMRDGFVASARGRRAASVRVTEQRRCVDRKSVPLLGWA